MTRRLALAALLVLLAVPLLGHDPEQFGAARSPHWPKVRAAYLEKHPACEACGATGSRVDLEVHHVIPFHLDASKELDASNLITLCRKGGHLGCACHLTFGHLGSFSRYNPSVREDAALFRQRLDAAKSQ